MNTQKCPAEGQADSSGAPLQRIKALAAAVRIYPLRARPLPCGNHRLADILREAKRLRAAGSAVGTPTTAPRSVAREIVRTGARVAGRLVMGDAFLNDGLPDLRVRKGFAGSSAESRQDDECRDGSNYARG